MSEPEYKKLSGEVIELTSEELAIFKQHYSARFQQVGSKELSSADAELALLLMPADLRWDMLARVRKSKK